MKIERIMEGNMDRHRAWCKIDELTKDSDGNYAINKTEDADALGDASEIIVMDSPGMMLYWDAEAQKAYVWAGGEENGQSP